MNKLDKSRKPEKGWAKTDSSSWQKRDKFSVNLFTVDSGTPGQVNNASSAFDVTKRVFSIYSVRPINEPWLRWRIPDLIYHSEERNRRRLCTATSTSASENFRGEKKRERDESQVRFCAFRRKSWESTTAKFQESKSKFEKILPKFNTSLLARRRETKRN